MKPLFTAAVVVALVCGVAACSSGDDEGGTTETTTDSTASAASEGVLGNAAAASGNEAPAAGEETPIAETPVVASGGEPAAVNPADLFTNPENILYLDLKCGRVVIEMRPDLAPQTVEQIKTLTREGFYDGLTFYRVVDGFMAQTGDPDATGFGHSDLPDLPPEFTNVPFDRGDVGMARGQPLNSGNSQFFIMFTRYPSLDGQYTLWGHVTEGMDCVDQINRGEPPANPDTIYAMRVAADVQ
jgi:peptidylprolyl isomerase